MFRYTVIDVGGDLVVFNKEDGALAQNRRDSWPPRFPTGIYIISLLVVASKNLHFVLQLVIFYQVFCAGSMINFNDKFQILFKSHCDYPSILFSILST